MLRAGIGILALVVALTSGATLLALWPIGQPVALEASQPDPRRGAYLARAGGCIACHSDPGSGRPALTGGAPIRTAFGSFVPPNITPDPDHGIGLWTLQDFARAVRQGIAPDGSPYYPAFPYAFYGGLSDQDIADMWAAFQGVPPRPETAGTHDLAFPFNLRFGLKLWRAAYLQAPPTTPDPARSATWNRGQWLVNGLSHCGACHTDRNLLGGRIASRHLMGNDDLPGGGSAPDITAAALTRAGWTASDLAFALQSGVTPGGDTFGGGMGKVVRHGTAWLTPEDRMAIARHLMAAD